MGVEKPLKMSRRQKIAVLLVLWLFILTPSIAPVLCQSSDASALQVAKTQLINGYLSVQQAEHAGANVTDLTETLNDAGLSLSQAEQAYSVGDYSSSQSLAVQCQEKLSDLNTKADTLKEAATQQATHDFWFAIIYPIFSSVAVIAVGIAVWFVLKRKYVSESVPNGSPTL